MFPPFQPASDRASAAPQTSGECGGALLGSALLAVLGADRIAAMFLAFLRFLLDASVDSVKMLASFGFVHERGLDLDVLLADQTARYGITHAHSVKSKDIARVGWGRTCSCV